MMMIFGKPAPLLFGQLLLGIVNGSFYAMLSLGLAVIFGILNIINFAHGALFMVGAFSAYLLLHWFGIGYWPALVLGPLAVGLFGAAIERVLLRPIRGLDPLYGLLLTFGLAEVLEGVFTNRFGSSGVTYSVPRLLRGTRDLGFMYLPNYHAFVVVAAIVVCLATWLVIEKTRLGAVLRAATENPAIVQALGIDVPRLVTLTFAGGVALAALAGVLAAPMYSVNPGMGSSYISIVFAVVVIGGMGSIGGAVFTGFLLGVVEGFTKVFYPPGAATVAFVVMVLVLLLRPAGLFGRSR